MAVLPSRPSPLSTNRRNALLLLIPHRQPIAGTPTPPAQGSFDVELYTREAPRTCKNFLELARKGYYNNTTFHRIIPNFMIQGGDPTGTGRGGDSIYGAPFEDECTRELKHTGAGILSMANAGKGTNKSQFFITCAPTPHLDGKHTIFGRVCSGMDVVQRMASVRTDPATDRPIDAVRIITATVEEE